MEKHLDIPVLSIVMSVYNGEKYLGDAIDSILAQTFTNYELLIIDDGSTDSSNKIIRSYDDARIRLLQQENKGLVESLNRGILEARGNYIARHDADDKSHPLRFEKQIMLLEQNPDIVIVGSSIDVIDEAGKFMHTHKVLLDDPELRQELLIRSPFAHGSVMFDRKVAIKSGLYDKNYWPAEDYEFWLRLSKFGALANINEALYVYRENPLGISSSNKKIQAVKVEKVRTDAWKQRKRLLKGRIVLAKYKRDERVDRILNNVRYGIASVKLRGGSLHAFRTSMSVILEPEAYRRLFGRIKRKVTSS